MTSILLLGGGGHCRSCIDVVESQGHFEIYGIIQPPDDVTSHVLGYPVLGDDETLPVMLARCPQALITVGQIKSPALRIRLYDRLKSLNATLPFVISRFAHLSPHAGIGEGTILMHGAIVNAGARVAENCIINTQALIEHDVTVEAHCHISTGARVNGGVVVRRGSFIGSGAILREGIEIGEGSVVGAGQVVLKSVPPGTVVRGKV